MSDRLSLPLLLRLTLVLSALVAVAPLTAQTDLDDSRRRLEDIRRERERLERERTRLRGEVHDLGQETATEQNQDLAQHGPILSSGQILIPVSKSHGRSRVHS